MNWFDKWIARKVRQAWDQEANVPINKATALITEDRLGDPTMNFRMHRAETGWIMEVGRSDRKTDRYSKVLHLIHDDEDLGDSIAKIITMETLRS